MKKPYLLISIIILIFIGCSSQKKSDPPQTSTSSKKSGFGTNSESPNDSLPKLPSVSSELKISDIEPTSGYVGGGDKILLSGSGFQQETKVFIGNTPCSSVVYFNPNYINCITPMGNGNDLTVSVQNPDTSDSDKVLSLKKFNYVANKALLTITKIDPTQGDIEGEEFILIYGTGFKDGIVVKIGDILCKDLLVISSIFLECKTSPGPAGDQIITIEDLDKTKVSSDPIKLKITDGPKVFSIHPNFVPLNGGDFPLFISGKRFVQPGLVVNIGPNLCSNPTLDQFQSISCKIPPGQAGEFDVIVKNPDGKTSIAKKLTYTDAPAPGIREVTPVKVSVNNNFTDFTIRGSNINVKAGVSILSFASPVQIKCTIKTFISPDEIICQTLKIPAGRFLINLENPDGQSATYGIFSELIAE